MPAYHTLHVLKDVQIEYQHEKTKTPLNIWCITILSLEVHILRDLIESMHEDPLVMLGISPWSHPQILRRRGKARKFGSLCIKAAPDGIHKGAFFGAACVSHYWWSCKNFDHILIVIYCVLGMIDFGLIMCSIQFKVQNSSLGRTFAFVNHWSRLSENRGRKRNQNSRQ